MTLLATLLPEYIEAKPSISPAQKQDKFHMYGAYNRVTNKIVFIAIDILDIICASKVKNILNGSKIHHQCFRSKIFLK